ncbi:hypothetical protein CAPTEDRAFT_222960 [Capitella teleta]|uniref:Cyclin-dependent kinase inhibitor domain-containing protein n=1 Tax=Capitella teleta TaxID=283909 RepID=X2ATT3_CAPTE|nr:hypothetical protein CAPTEDRAFT_222960 [Capitella teleta]|eukprot:ELU04694.1 hypothetical protein CAPTEDRAFT_222960 [Capitella teleta]
MESSSRPAWGFPASKGVKRRLVFADEPPHVDHELNKRELARIERQLNDRDRVNWNFDFVTCSPCVGRYEWQPVECDNPSEVPEAYRLPHLDLLARKLTASRSPSPINSTSECSPSPRRKRKADATTQTKISAACFWALCNLFHLVAMVTSDGSASGCRGYRPQHAGRVFNTN